MKYLIIIFSILYWGCGTQSNSVGAESEGTALQFKISNETINCDSLKIVFIKKGTILQTESLSWISDDYGYTLDNIPSGDSVQIEVSLFDENSTVLYIGSVVTDVQMGVLNNVAITLDPMFTSVHIDVPVGLANIQNIEGGSLSIFNAIDTVTSTLTGEVPMKAFDIEVLAFGTGYEVSLYLWNTSRDTLYQYNTIMDIDASSSADLQFSLESLISQLSLDISLAEQVVQSGSVAFPDAGFRNVDLFNDLIITEISPYPRSSGDDYEWIEFFNTSMDTLNLNGCALKKTLTSTSTTTYIAIEEELTVAPSSFAILGRDSVDFADYIYHSFLLSNSGQAIYLECNAVVIDSVLYNASDDIYNPFPIKEGHSLDIELADITRRTNGSFWCEGVAHYSFANGLQNYGSPRSFGICDTL